MSKVPKWKIEKAKVKVVFRLQFHATHIPQAGWDKLFVLFISGDTGKLTAKTNKANVRNGNCKWSDPIYEATRLIQDSRTKKYDEKLYKLVVAMGSSRSSILGEAEINLAEFAEAQKPHTVALSLHGCDSGTLLHVTVQLLTTKTGFREFEQTRELSVKSPQRISNQKSDRSDVGAPSSDSVGDEVNAKDKLKESSLELHSVEDCDDSSAGVDGLSCASDRSYAEKNDIYATHDINSFKSTISGNVGGFPLSPSPRPEKEDRQGIRLSTQGSNDWTHGLSSNYSADNYLAMAHEENNRLRVRLEVAESAFLQLKSEAKSLQCITDELGAETQSLAQQFAIELASGEQLTTEVRQLKSECLALKNDLEKLKSVKSLQHVPDRESSHIVNPNNLIDDLRINWLQDLQRIESKIREIQYEACLGFHETGFDSLLADFEILRHIVDNIKELHNTDQSTLQHGPLNKNVDSVSTMQEKMCELLEKLEGSKTEKEILVKKINHMNSYYEAFIHELEESQKQTMIELENLRNEHSSCRYTNSFLQAQMEKAHQDMDEQMASFAEDRKILESQNKELEKRATASETALRSVRRNYSLAVDRIQKDLELLSFQVLSMYESNETLAKQALVDAYHSCPKEHLEETHLCCHTHDQNEYKPDVKQTRQESRDIRTDFQLSPVHNGKICQLEAAEDEKLNSQSEAYINDSCCNNLLQEAAGHSSIQMENALFSVDLKGTETKAVLGTSTILAPEDDSQSFHNAEGNFRGANNINEMKMSLHSLKDLCSTLEAELLDMHVVNIQWEVFSDILVQMVRDENDRTGIMKQRLIELERQLHDSTKVRESLMLKLHNALNQAKILRENKAKYISECDNLTVKNQILAAKLEDISSETALLTEKLAEYKKLIMECKVHETKYKDCTEERNKLENLLIQESSHKSRLENEIGSMIGDFNALKEESNRLQELITYLHGGLADLCANMISCSKQIDAFTFNDASLQQELESMNYGAIISNLEKFQEEACRKIFQLHQEKEEEEEMKATFQSSLKKVESDMFDMRQKLQSEMEATTTKLDVSSKLIENFEQELEDVTEKYKLSTESEEKLAKTNGELTSRLALLEAELQHLTSESRSLMDCANEELKRMKFNLVGCQQENSSLKESVHVQNEATILLENELSKFKEALSFTHEDLQTEKRLRENFEYANTNLLAQLEEKQQLLFVLDEEKTELSQKHEESQRKLLDENLSLHLQLSTNVRQLELVLEDLLVTENEVTYMRSQMQELLLKHMEADSLLRVHMSNEAALHDKNLRIETALQSLKSEFEEVIGKKIDTKSQHASIEHKNYEKQSYENEILQLKDEKQSYENEILQLKDTLISLEELVDSLTLSTIESEITSMILRSKSDEQKTIILMLKKSEHELINLRQQHSDLSSKLSEQIMKTEEYKNLSIHLRELKEKSDAEHHQECRKRENEGSPFAMQESLRIAFIKEQYESKIHELKNQLSISKKYAEEMLVKLQNALDEVESGKRNEISLAKRIEELSMKLSDTETELHQVLTDRRELVTAYDNIKTELECTMLSFDCCKEEKLGLESSFQECNEERRKVKVELDLVKRLLQSMALTENNLSHGTHESHTPLVTPIGQLLEDGSSADMLQEVSNIIGISSEKDGDGASCTNLSNTVDEDNLLKTSLINSCEGDSQNAQNEPGSESLSEDGLVGDITIQEHFKEQERLKIGMKLFQKELERLKAQNLSSLPLEVDQNDSSLRGLERALSQLDMANEQLGTLFPSFKDLPGCGNALERVLALELELAEVLQAKKKSDIHFQSSFLKQHNDEAAVFQSFRDINELIQDMLELKKQHAAAEGELKEMQGRYSQLSLQFAEVEGERQQLIMTLKNRTPKKLSQVFSVWKGEDL